MKIRIPKPPCIPSQNNICHTVVSGDYLYGIAAAYDTSFNIILKLNENTLGLSFTLKLGMKLLVPRPLN